MGDGEGFHDGLPAVDLAGGIAPVQPPLHHCQVERFERSLFGREVPSSPRGCAEVSVQRFGSVGRVHKFADLRWVVRERDELSPEPFRQLHHGRILALPELGKRFERDAGLVGVHSPDTPA